MKYLVTVSSNLEKEEHLFTKHPTIISILHPRYNEEVKDVINSFHSVYKNSIAHVPVIILEEESHKVYIYEDDFFSIKGIKDGIK